MRASAVRKVTPGITDSCRVRVHIVLGVWSLAVGSSHPGRAGAAKGAGVHRLKGIISWVQYVARQYGC
ncbi:MAG: hypothetical protein DRP08_01940 [Candidatus Aenigmatarchaeota archaeon]|nr:MAG: hypothetical protein DRP08_01940 [Candidatus Aenigmarchaeota archaeon]